MESNEVSLESNGVPMENFSHCLFPHGNPTGTKPGPLFCRIAMVTNNMANYKILTRCSTDRFSAQNLTDAQNTCRCYLFTYSTLSLLFSRRAYQALNVTGLPHFASTFSNPDPNPIPNPNCNPRVVNYSRRSA